jgi:hypothetical protein
MLRMFRTIYTKVPIVENGRVTPCPQLSKEQLADDDAGAFVPYPIHVYPTQTNSWAWAWISGNPGWAIQCWLMFAKYNQQYIEAARLACRAAVEDAATLTDKVS